MKNLIAFALIVSALTVYSQKTKSVTFQTWTNGAWADQSRFVNTLDNFGHVGSSLHEVWTQSLSAWSPYSKSNYTNTAGGNAIQSNEQSWDKVAGVWNTVSVVQNTYNSTNQLQTFLIQNVVSGSLQNVSLINNIYDANGYLKESVNFQWSGAWVVMSKTNCTIDINGISAELYQTMVSGSLVNKEYTTYTLSSPGKLSESITKTWSGSSWQNSQKTIYTYDQFGYMIMWEYFTWSNGNWVPAAKADHTNYGDGRLDFFIQQVPNGNTWVNTQKVIYEWFSSSPTGIAEYSDESSQPVLYFDLNGRAVEKQNNVLLIQQQGNIRRKVIFQE